MKSKKTISIIFFTLFIDLIGFAMLIPIVPQLLANPNAPFYLLPKGMSIASGYILLGYLLAIFPFMQFLTTPILGQLSDKYGRKKILAFSILGTCLSYIIFAWGLIVKDIVILFVARAFAGLAGGNIAVAQAAVADITSPENRAKSFALVGGAMGLGVIFGPIIGGKLSDPAILSWFDSATPFWFATILSFLNFISVSLFFPETHTNLNNDTKIIWHKAFTNISKAYSISHLRINFSSHFLFQLGYAFFLTFISVLMIHKFNYTQGNLGNWFTFIGICAALSQILLAKLLSKKFSEYNILKVSYVGAGITILLFFFSTAPIELYLIGFFCAPFIALSQSFTSGLISRSVGGKIQGEILGITASIQGLALSIPPILAGYIAGKFTPESPILVSSIVIIAGGILFLIFYKPYTQLENQQLAKGGN